MANSSRQNPFFIDTASSSRLVSDTTEVMITGIIPIASAATWSIILKDGSTNIIYSANNNIGIPSFPAIPFKTTGLVVDTLTNATGLIYTTPG